MSLIKKNLGATLLALFLLALPLISFAQPAPTGGVVPPPPTGGVSDPCKGKICNPIKVDTIQDFIKTLLEGVLKIGIPIVALAVIYCGFLFVKARGNSEELTKAKDALLYTLIGAAILLGSWSIAILITDTVTSLKP